MSERSTSTSRTTASTPGATPKPRKRAASSTRSELSAPSPSPSHDAIAARAHELYVQSGFQGGRELEFWLEAERELKRGLQLH